MNSIHDIVNTFIKKSIPILRGKKINRAGLDYVSMDLLIISDTHPEWRIRPILLLIIDSATREIIIAEVSYVE